MKNKKITYILIPAVVLIWGLIFYKFMNGLSGNDSSPVTVSHVLLPDSAIFLPDTFSLNPVYRDPFLGKQLVVHTGDEIVRPTTTVKAPAAAPMVVPSSIPWPAISYGGVIKSMKYDKQVAIATIDGKEYLFKQGDILAGIQAVAVFKDSVKFKRDKELRVFRK